MYFKIIFYLSFVLSFFLIVFALHLTVLTVLTFWSFAQAQFLPFSHNYANFNLALLKNFPTILCSLCDFIGPLRNVHIAFDFVHLNILLLCTTNVCNSIQSHSSVFFHSFPLPLIFISHLVSHIAEFFSFNAAAILSSAIGNILGCKSIKGTKRIL